MTLTEQQLDRYFHHVALKDIGGDGQRKLLSSRVLIIGAGGLSSPAALYLAAAGIGTIGICDGDRVEISNLQRQILHNMKDIGRDKVSSALEKMNAINPDVTVIPHNERLTGRNAKKLFAGYNFIIDGSDNFETKYVINDTCVETGKSYSHAGVVGFRGQTFTFVPGSLCLRCIFANPPEAGTIMSCRGEGILGPVAGIIGCIQATEAIKFILKKGGLLLNRLLTLDALDMQFRPISISKNPNCPACRDRNT